jgi:hypothetical protein
MKKQSRYISNENKEIILKRQNYRCANTPDANLYRIGDFPCVLWEGTRKGVFMESGYEFDHVIEFSLTRENNINNLQALCHSCHAYKTKDFQRELALARNKGIIGECTITIDNIPSSKYDELSSDFDDSKSYSTDFDGSESSDITDEKLCAVTKNDKKVDENQKKISVNSDKVTNYLDNKPYCGIKEPHLNRKRGSASYHTQLNQLRYYGFIAIKQSIA